MHKPLQILYITSNMPWRGGGTFYRAFGFAKTLVARGHQVTLLATGLENKRGFETDRADGVTIVSSPSWLTGKLRTGWDPFESWQRIRWLKGKQFDVVHAFETRPTIIYPALSTQKHQQARLFFDWCDWFGRGGIVEERDTLTKLILSPIETFYEEHFRHRARATTVINHPLRERAISLGVASETIHWLPNGAETQEIKMIDRNKAREALELEETWHIIGYLGHAFPRDAALIGQAFAEILRQRPQARLLLIGNYRGSIPEYISDKDALLNSGFVHGEALNNYLAACDVLWLTMHDSLANRGRWPMKLSDYMSSGRAIVSTDVGDWARLFRGERPIGLLAKDTPEDIANQTMKLFDHEDQRMTLGQNARNLVETQFDWKLITKELEAFYYRFLN